MGGFLKGSQGATRAFVISTAFQEFNLSYPATSCFRVHCHCHAVASGDAGAVPSAACSHPSCPSQASGGKTEPANIQQAYIFAACMFIAPMLGSVCYVQSNRLSIGTQVLVRAELTAGIYRKAQFLSNTARQSVELGKIVNLMSADMNNIVNVFYPFFSMLVSAPITLVVSFILLWLQI